MRITRSQHDESAFPRPTGYLAAQEVADIFHVGPKTVSRWAKQGKLPFMRTLGGHRRYPADQIEAMAKGLEAAGEFPTTTA